MNHKVLQSTVNSLLLDCDHPSYRINRFRNIKCRRPSVVCCPSVDNELALKCTVLKLYPFRG